MDRFDNLVSAKEIAKTLDMSVATVNYYTNLGLFTTTDRKGNVRLYNKRKTMEFFGKVRQLRKEGYSLLLIQKKFEKEHGVSIQEKEAV